MSNFHNMNADPLFDRVHEMFDVIASAIRRDAQRVVYWQNKDIEMELAAWFRKYLEKKLGMRMPVLVHMLHTERSDHRFCLVVEILVDIPVAHGDFIATGKKDVAGFRMFMEDMQIILLHGNVPNIRLRAEPVDIIDGNVIATHFYPFNSDLQGKVFFSIDKRKWEYNKLAMSYELPDRFWDVGFGVIETNILVQLSFNQNGYVRVKEFPFNKEKDLQVQLVCLRNGEEELLLTAFLESYKN